MNLDLSLNNFFDDDSINGGAENNSLQNIPKTKTLSYPYNDNCLSKRSVIIIAIVLAVAFYYFEEDSKKLYNKVKE